MKAAISPNGARRAFFSFSLVLPLGLCPSAYAAGEMAPDDIAAYCAYFDNPSVGSNVAVSGDQAIDLCMSITEAFGTSPDLKARQSGIEAGDGRLQQASLRPNPALDTSIEDFAGTGAAKGFDGAEITATWNQPIELGDKRSRREGLARSENALSKVEYAETRADVILAVKERFIELLAAEESLMLAERRRSIADELVTTARRRVSSGGGTAGEGVKAKLSLSGSEIALEQARRAVEVAKRRLATRIGRPHSALRARGGLDQPVTLPSWDDLERAVAGSLGVQKAELENERRRATVLLEEAKASSDITVSAGLRHARESGATGVIVGLSVPLPIFDRNQGAILEAQKVAAAGDFDLKGETVRTASDLRDAYEDMAAAIETARKLKAELLPAAKEGLETANKAYRLGRLSYLEVIDAQRTYFDTHEEFIKSLTTFHTARARAERLIGMGLDNVAKGQRSDVKSTESTK